MSLFRARAPWQLTGVHHGEEMAAAGIQSRGHGGLCARVSLEASTGASLPRHPPRPRRPPQRTSARSLTRPPPPTFRRSLGLPTTIEVPRHLRLRTRPPRHGPAARARDPPALPHHRASEKARREQAEQSANNNAASEAVSPAVWFTRQTIGNACGTIGVLHAVANTQHEYPIADDSWFARFFAATRTMTPVERAAHLEADDSPRARACGAASSATSSTAVPEADEEVDLHFVALVHVDGGCTSWTGARTRP